MQVCPAEHGSQKPSGWPVAQLVKPQVSLVTQRYVPAPVLSPPVLPSVAPIQVSENDVENCAMLTTKAFSSADRIVTRWPFCSMQDCDASLQVCELERVQ